MTPEEIQLFKTAKLDRIQIRVCSVLKNWLDEHYNDFENCKPFHAYSLSITGILILLFVLYDGCIAPSLKSQLQDMLSTMIEKSASALSTRLGRNLIALIRNK
jgi:hypothetical protein